METQMKKCRRCGRELPKNEFHKSSTRKDGLQSECKSCRKEMDAIRRANNKNTSQNTLHKVYSNTELAQFTPRQLMQELKDRGFKWDYMLEPQKKVFYDKI